MRLEKRMTLNEISECLAINKPTVWNWIKDLDVRPAGPGESRRKSITERRRAAIKATWAERRHAAYREGWEEFDALIEEPGFRDFLCLYVGEGYKRSRNTASIANSDPRVISLADGWLRRLSPREPKYQVLYHADQDVDYLKRFWSFRLGCEPNSVRAYMKSNSGRLEGRTWRSRWGVFTVSVHDTYLRSRLQAWLDRLQNGWLDSLASGRGAAW